LIRPPGRREFLKCVYLLTACGGGTPNTPDNGVGNENPPIADAIADIETEVSAEDAARLLAQATFGTTLQDIERVQQLGFEAWIDNQFHQPGSSQLDYMLFHPGSSSLSGPRQQKWMIDAIEGEDQLRQRVAFALSEIFVTSDLSQTLGREQDAMANYYDILLNNLLNNSCNGIVSKHDSECSWRSNPGYSCR